MNVYSKLRVEVCPSDDDSIKLAGWLRTSRLSHHTEHNAHNMTRVYEFTLPNLRLLKDFINEFGS